jgi:DNA-binding NarL/FixJ family response regulator
MLNYNLKLFTPRELVVLQYLSNGMRNKEIATALFVSDDTIKKHLYNMFQKLSVKNRLSLVSKARELGLI